LQSIHEPGHQPDDGWPGRYRAAIQPDASGGTYAPYVVEPWTKVEVAVGFVLRPLHLDPYVVMLMKSSLLIH